VTPANRSDVGELPKLLDDVIDRPNGATHVRP